MPDFIETTNKTIEAIALEVVTLEGDDIPAIGVILNHLCELEEGCRDIDQPSFLDITSALKEYLEKIILGDTDDLGPVEEGVSCLQSIHRSLSNEKPYTEDTSDILNSLGFSISGFEGGDVGDEHVDAESSVDIDPGPSGQNLSEDDADITRDFVAESLENLATIEVSLMDLEQNPDDMEIINTIFRPFHTIKGVSGFINLNKINKLAHSSENLLDKARNEELRVEGAVIDIILESVDMLKRMIQGVREGLESGTSLDNGLDIIPLMDRIEETNARAQQMQDKPVGEILIQEGVINADDLERALETQRGDQDKKIGEILIQENKVNSKEIISALREQKKFKGGQADLQVKVDTKKLDDLVDLTGELVIAQSMLRQNQWILSGSDEKLQHNLSQLTQITSGLQTTAMSMRMVPIKNTFQKMVRLIRDLAKNSGKEVRLLMTGEDTEIDRNVVEELYEPMVHMIRNAVDHGIETPEEREKAGKKKKGTIHLRAFHKGGKIIIEIEDDGKGLNKERIIEKAKSSNIITDESNLKDTDIYNLIFRPGFSTAKKVTDVSGRGVGMDVVKRGIEKLRGRVEISSRPGRGSTFTIGLPLTLAIIDGMVVRVGQERYIIPVLAIMKSFRPEKDKCSTVQGKGEMVLSRGNLLPLVRLDHLFRVKSDSTHPWDGLAVTVEHEHEQMCILLDELLGKEEVVIKSLGEGMKNIKGLTGGAIMGDGRVGLILDMAGIFEVAKSHGVCH